MKYTEEDLAIAGLASLVGSELKTIDTFTVQGKNGPANKIDPRAFLSKNPNRPQNKQVVRHDGHAFYAGLDESIVQSLHPDPVPAAPQPEYKQTEPPPTANTTKPSLQVAIKPNKPVSLPQTNEYQDTLIKTLKSIDKTLKVIAKTLQPETK